MEEEQTARPNTDSVLARSVIALAWHFGARGVNGECCSGLGLPEFIALYKVSSTPDCSVHAVGRALGFTKSGATRIVDRLERRGHIRKVRSCRDGRVCCVVITSRGREVLQTAEARYARELRELTARMPGPLAAQAAGFLAAMAEAAPSASFGAFGGEEKTRLEGAGRGQSREPAISGGAGRKGERG